MQSLLQANRSVWPTLKAWRQLAPSTADVASRASCAWVWLGREMAKALIRECLKAVRGSFPGCCGRGRLAYR
jgi:hypothetical protein